VQGYTPRKNQSSRWDSVNGPVSPRRDILRDWTRTSCICGYRAPDNALSYPALRRPEKEVASEQNTGCCGAVLGLYFCKRPNIR
jgi:hypothetical protein